MSGKIGFVLGASGALGSCIVSKLAPNYEVVCVDVRENVDSRNKFLKLDLSSADAQAEITESILSYGKNFSFIVDATGLYHGGDGGDNASNEYMANTIGWQSPFYDNLTRRLVEVSQDLSNKPLFLHILSGASFNGSRDINYSVVKSAHMGLVLGLARKYANKSIHIGLASGCLDKGMADKMGEDRKAVAVSRTVNKIEVSTNELSIFASQLIESKLNSLNGIIIPFGENPAWIDYVTS